MTRDRGSTIPLILGFFLLALVVTAGAVAAADDVLAQRDLQGLCDSAAAAAAGSAANLDRATPLGAGGTLAFAEVQRAVDAFLARDPARAGVRVAAALSPDARTLSLTCREQRPVAFGALFGYPAGLAHTANASARAPVS